MYMSQVFFTGFTLFQCNRNKGNAKRGVSPRLKIWPGDLDLWPWKSIGFQILLKTKYVPSLVKIHWRMLILGCSQWCYGRTDSNVTMSLRNFVGDGIITILLFRLTKVNEQQLGFPTFSKGHNSVLYTDISWKYMHLK